MRRRSNSSIRMLHGAWRTSDRLGGRGARHCVRASATCHPLANSLIHVHHQRRCTTGSQPPPPHTLWPQPPATPTDAGAHRGFRHSAGVGWQGLHLTACDHASCRLCLCVTPEKKTRVMMILREKTPRAAAGGSEARPCPVLTASRGRWPSTTHAPAALLSADSFSSLAARSARAGGRSGTDSGGAGNTDMNAKVCSECFV